MGTRKNSGAISRTTFPFFSIRCSKCNLGACPRKATVAINFNICTGVTFRLPWPIDTEIVSPGNHFCRNIFIFQSLLGTRPAFSLGRSTALWLPKPISWA